MSLHFLRFPFTDRDSCGPIAFWLLDMQTSDSVGRAEVCSVTRYTNAANMQRILTGRHDIQHGRVSPCRTFDLGWGPGGWATAIGMSHVHGYGYGIPILRTPTPSFVNLNRVVLNATIMSRKPDTRTPSEEGVWFQHCSWLTTNITCYIPFRATAPKARSNHLHLRILVG